ncbi:MAG: hypothetical protein B7Y12_04880 [Rhizobiales bacterium 24-66-13]|jgi:hypothetical protein|nr:MAG: hypothetical protein B7Z41_06755 [Rhizobiales bacterium 12-66-7]OYY88486.1 MAG: hypothetical protein B7Y61_02195 [Rhizobiales bacterium 35-66-30]OYZ82110.1 MAG: hypothetical protein B7Y12_04880 [Rhizobiales bacterium 24-66-13]OZB11381.1 MAG: hypothetical protein B7X67_03990 [Rhizobiales bacterium 39-66-18]HQS45742.1 hypothetical protein [Xanthobacteraceae bacterium]
MKYSGFGIIAAILLVLGVGCPRAALAQANGGKKAMVADCSGKECRCHLSDLTLNDMAILLGTDVPADPESFVMIHGDEIGWSKVSIRDAETVIGGDGTCDLELFQDWTPEDGAWDGTTTLRGVSGAAECRQIGGMIVTMMNGKGMKARVAWKGVFDMNVFQAATNPGPEDDHPKWTQVDHHTVTGAGGGDGMATSYKARLLTPRRFLIDTRISGEGCVFSLRHDVRKAD